MNWKIGMADNWRRLHRKGTVILASLFAAVAAFGPTLVDTWNLLPQDLKAALPEGTARWVSTVAFLLVVFVRYTSIRKKDKGGRDDSA